VAAQRDYYRVLGVPRDADAGAIKDAFRRLARRYHPDASTEPDAEERFKEDRRSVRRPVRPWGCQKRV
jgi:molecular chaperone DnaJ